MIAPSIVRTLMLAIVVVSPLSTLWAAMAAPSEADPMPAPEWLPGESFDKYAWIKLNKMRDVNTGKEYPPAMPPNESVVVNISVVNKLAGDPAEDIINFAVLHLEIRFPADPSKVQSGEVRMWNKNGSLNRNEWWADLGGGGAGGNSWPLPMCSQVRWFIKIWDVANREINSSNSLAASSNQNFTVGGGTQNCLIPPGARFQHYFDVEQTPYSANESGARPPAETAPGPGLPAALGVRVHLVPKRWLQMPWVILFVNQSLSSGEFNSSWLVGVRGYCLDFSVSPNVCDISGEKENPQLTRRNGTEFVFDLPGFYPGTGVQYSIVVVDHAIPDYARDAGYLTDPWGFTTERRFCAARPQSCLSSPEFYYHVPRAPPICAACPIGPLAAQLLVEVSAASGRKIGLDLVSEGCVQFGNSTWSSQIYPVNAYGYVQGPTVDIRATPVASLPIVFWAKAWARCNTGDPIIQSKAIPNVDGPDFTTNGSFIFIFGAERPLVHPDEVTGWHGDDFLFVYGIAMTVFIVPTLMLAIRWFSSRRRREEEKHAETELRFKI